VTDPTTLIGWHAENLYNSKLLYTTVRLRKFHDEPTMSLWNANVYIAVTTSAGDENIKDIKVDARRYVASMVCINKATTKKKIHIFTENQY